MKTNKKAFAAIMIAVMTAASMPQSQLTAVYAAGSESAAVAKKGYSLSKKAGTYSKTIRLKLTAKNGYWIYYAKNGNLTAKKVLKSGQSKTFTIKKTTTLTVYRSKTVKTAKQLQSSEVKKSSVSYVYKITKKNTAASQPTAPDTDTNASQPTAPDTDTNASQPTAPDTDTNASQPTAPDTDTNTSQPTTPDTSTNATQPTAPNAGSNPIQPSAPTAGSNQPTDPDNSGSHTQPSRPGNTPGTRPGQTSSDDKGDPDTAQDTASAMLATANAKETSVANAKPAAKNPTETTAQTPVITCSKAQATVSNLTDNSSVTTSIEDGVCQITIKKAGTYILTGGTKNVPAENITVSVDCDTKDAVHLVLDNLHIDNSNMGSSSSHDQPVICIEKDTENVDITLTGASSLTGNGSFAKEPASAVVYAEDSDTVLTFLAADASASLTVTDAMDTNTDLDGNDPSDGISAKGTLILQSGIYNISSNGDCLKGSGDDGSGGITVSGGTYRLKSMLGNGMRSKNGTITIYDGTVNISYTAEDGINAKNHAVNITGGNITIDQCNGDGIQGEDVFITGSNTKLDITTVFANAGKNYYNSALGSGNYNTLTKTNTTKTEVVNVDTGSHKGIKAGTKACTYSYRSVKDDSSLEAGKTYTEKASGGIIITGGQIKISTTGTGIKYNGSMKADQSSNSGNIAPADNEGQYIIGAAEDAVHSNNLFFMSGGTLEIASADDGISAESSLVIVNDSTINITESYEGMEGGMIIIGATGKTAPQITVYSNDDGVNAASKASVHYDYADESEETYTKTQTAANDNAFYMLDGYLNVMIADDTSHTFSLPVEDGSTTEGSYTADGDGIDCNGSFYAYGGTVIVYGPASNGNSPIDTDGAYYIGEGVTILAAGSGGMTEAPTGMAQAAVTCGGMGGGMMTPGGNKGNGMTPPDGSNGNGFTPPDGNNGNGFTPPDGNNSNFTPPDISNGNGATSPDDSIGNGNGANSPDDSIGNGMAPSGGNNDNNTDLPDGSNSNGMAPPDSSNGITPPNGSNGMTPGGDHGDHTMPDGQTNAISVSAGTSVAILDSNGKIVTAFKAPKAISYLFYSSPSLTEGNTYTISSGGSVSGTPVYSGSNYDHRYTEYLTDNASTLIEVTASK